MRGSRPASCGFAVQDRRTIPAATAMRGVERWRRVVATRRRPRQCRESSARNAPSPRAHAAARCSASRTPRATYRRLPRNRSRRSRTRTPSRRGRWLTRPRLRHILANRERLARLLDEAQRPEIGVEFERGEGRSIHRIWARNAKRGQNGSAAERGRGPARTARARNYRRCQRSARRASASPVTRAMRQSGRIVAPSDCRSGSQAHSSPAPPTRSVRNAGPWRARPAPSATGGRGRRRGIRV